MSVAMSVAKADPAGVERVDALTEEAPEATRVLDNLAGSLARHLHELARPICRAADALDRDDGWFSLGYARAEDFARERLGRSGRWLRDMAALGRATRESDGLLLAMTGRDGGPPLGTVAALAIARGTSSEFRATWIAVARALGVRELKRRLCASRDAGVGYPIDAAGQRDDTHRPPDALVAWVASTCPELLSGPAYSETARLPWNRRFLQSRGIPVAGAEPSSPPPRAPSLEETIASDEQAPRATVRLDLPAPIVAAFHEVRWLHGRIVGTGSSTTDFVEALVGEARAAGLAPRPDLDGALEQLCRAGVRDDAAREERWNASRRTSAPEPPPGCSPPADRPVVDAAASAALRETIAAADALLARSEALFATAGSGDTAELAYQLHALVELERPIRRALGRLLAEMARRRGWNALGYAGIRHYAEERLGMSRSTAEDLATLARSVEQLPVVGEAHEAGRLSSVAALRVVRILGRAAAVPVALQHDWVAHAEAVTIKRLDDERDAIRWKRLVACDGARPVAGPLSDAEWHGSLRRAAGETTIRIGECAVLAARHPAAVATLRLTLPFDLAADLLGALAAAERCVRTFSTDLPPFEARWLSLYALLTAYVGAHDLRRGPQGTFARDGWRCMAPGCTSSSNLEDHHVIHRARGGGDAPDNRVTLCRFHHQRGEHGGIIRVRGRAPLELEFDLGGRTYRAERAAPVNSPVAPSFLNTAAAGQNPVKADWKRFRPTKVVRR